MSILGRMNKYIITILCVLCCAGLTILTFSAALANDLDQQLLDAAGKGEAKRVMQLLELGASPDARDKYQGTPLIYSAWYGYVEVMKLLLCYGAEVDARQQQGQTALHGAASNCRTDAVKLLLCSGADADAKNKVGQTPLGWCTCPN